LAEPGPVVIEALVDPFETPMPPKATLEQTRKFAESLIRGTPNREKIALTVISHQVRELL
jgi:pyruvate dehydrogenase (quinone)